ncbi:hypothetical protein BDZ45DRAFT_549299, partial [Acephala macrosclerotiorum]
PLFMIGICNLPFFFLDFGVRMVHMLLMSWAAEQERNLAAETSGAATKLLDCGVEHHDVRPPNVIWNPEIRNVVLVDFERSEILKQ